MRTFASLAFIAILPVSPPSLPTASFHWQRTATPPAGPGMQEACIVLDADTFSHAEPGLTDLRLFQDGAELPYAVEESFDKRALERDTALPDDRSIYETSQTERAYKTPHGISPGNMEQFHPLPSKKDDEVRFGFSANFRLPSRVPVERMKLDPAPDVPEQVEIRAWPEGEGGHQESVRSTITPAQPELPFTLGANLQTDAKVYIDISNTDRVIRSVILEMRRRSLCYRPRSLSPLVLRLGSTGLPAPHYDFAEHFSTIIDRPLATLGPLLPNPDFHPEPEKGAGLSRLQRLEIATLLSAAFFFFSAKRVLRVKKSPTR